MSDAVLYAVAAAMLLSLVSALGEIVKNNDVGAGSLVFFILITFGSVVGGFLLSASVTVELIKVSGVCGGP